MQATPSKVELFWSRVDKTPDCWLWTAAKMPSGRGVMRWNTKAAIAYRIAWELTNGPIPEGLWVCHHCDNPTCVRPDHLFLGTRRDNVRDMWAKGRQSPPPHQYGERHHNVTVPDATVAACRSDCAEGMSVRDVATKYGLRYGLVYSWVVRKTRTI